MQVIHEEVFTTHNLPEKQKFDRVQFAQKLTLLESLVVSRFITEKSKETIWFSLVLSSNWKVKVSRMLWHSCHQISKPMWICRFQNREIHIFCQTLENMC